MKWPLVFVVIILVAGLCAGDYEHSYEYRRTRTGYPSDHRSELTSDLYSIRTKTKSSSEGVLNRPELCTSNVWMMICKRVVMGRKESRSELCRPYDNVFNL